MPVKVPRADELEPDRDAQPRRVARLAVAAPAVVAAARLRQRRSLSAQLRRGGVHPAGPALARGSGAFPVHGEGATCATTIRSACSPCRASESCACTHRAARPASRRSSATPRRTSTRGRTLMARSIRAAGGRRRRHRARRLRLRALHRRARRPLRRRAAGLHGDPDVGRADREAGAAHLRLQARHHHGDAVVHARDRRGVRAAGHRSAQRARCSVGIFGAEPWTEAMRAQIEAAHGHRCRRHLRPVGGDRARASRTSASRPRTARSSGRITSIRRSSIRRPARCCRDGEHGELVFTSLTKEAMPIIRYRTRDLTRLLPPTARSMRRMAKIVGRSDDMLIIRGVNVFPTQIEELILKIPALAPHYVLEVTREGPLDAHDRACRMLRPTATLRRASASARRRWSSQRQILCRGQRARRSAQRRVRSNDRIGKAKRVIDEAHAADAG